MKYQKSWKDQPGGHFQSLVQQKRTEADDHRDAVERTLRRRVNGSTVRQLMSACMLSESAVRNALATLKAQSVEGVWYEAGTVRRHGGPGIPAGVSTMGADEAGSSVIQGDNGRSNNGRDRECRN